METNQDLKERHLYSIKGVFPKYIIKKFLSSYSTYVSIGIAIILYLLIIFFQRKHRYDHANGSLREGAVAEGD